jgi:hypothetical protein
MRAAVGLAMHAVAEYDRRVLRIVIAMIALGACGGGEGGGTVCSFAGETYLPGERFPAGDGCNSCECQPDGSVACTEIGCPDGGVDANPASCAPSNGCPSGPGVRHDLLRTR